MNHIAILKRAYLEKIISGTKTVESRWSMNRIIPFTSVHIGDTIYLKYSGGPVAAKCKVIKVEYYKDLDRTKIERILRQHGKQIGIDNKLDFFKEVKDKRYCSLFWLNKLELIDTFDIDKKGYGNQAAWIMVDKISKIKKKL